MKNLIRASFAQTLAMFAAWAVLAAPSAWAQDKIAGDVAAGQKKNAMCIGCHGIAGYQASFPEIYKVPMIAGQSAPYLVASLKAYKKGDRKHPTMRGIAQTLSDQDMADLAAFYETQTGPRAALPAEPAKTPDAKVAELLKKGNCSACHGANYSQPIDGSYPKLAGQHADYLYVSLRAYGTQSNALVGRNHAIMGAQVKPFTNADLKGMSKYLASLPGEMKTVAQDKFK